MQDHDLLSRPIRLHWAGWTADTYSLQRAGWSLTAEQDISRYSMQLGLRSPNGDSYGVSSRVPWEYATDRAIGFAPLDLGADIRFGRSVEFHVTELPNFRAIDALPQMVRRQRVCLEDFAHFHSPLVRTQEIVVPEESVEELMARILKMQQPDRTARIRESLRNPEGYRMETLPKQKFHAQILSFAA